MNIIHELRKAIAGVVGGSVSDVVLSHPDVEAFGDFSTNAALVFKGGRGLAEKIAETVRNLPFVEKVEVAGLGFVNISIQTEWLIKEVNRVIDQGSAYGNFFGSDDHELTEMDENDRYGAPLLGKKLMVEFAHPNTHKELHIGHMRTLITGEALSRLLAAAGATVFRANYQGDIGPHVAKAIWGTQLLMQEKEMSFESAEELSDAEKAHLLGEGYVRGNQDYESHKEEIDQLNRDLYAKKPGVWEIYQRTRRWSLNYYDTFYSRFGTHFDRLFFESEVADRGVELVKNNVGKVFTESEGAIVFEGEPYGLHTRVFVTAAGTPTYEGKEIALAYSQYNEFPFDRCIHVVANEQAGYFKVVIKALELLDTQFEGKEFHLSMGMVNLVGRKMSSRTGEILRVDALLDEIKDMVRPLIKTDTLNPVEVEDIAEKTTMAAVKYSILKVDPVADVAFDLKQSVNIEGNSGPYLQYTYARTRSVLSKAGAASHQMDSEVLNPEELSVVRAITRYQEVITDAAMKYKPSLLCTYLFDLAQKYNTFYNQHSILNADNEATMRLRLGLTEATGQIIKNGLGLLGIPTPERM